MGESKRSNPTVTGLLIAFCLTALTTSALFGLQRGGRIEWAGLYYVNEASRELRISAVGPAVARVAGSVGGVLFQATARPSDDLTAQTVRLGSVANAAGGVDLVTYFDDVIATASSPAWVWVPAARFADSEYTAAVTLYSNANTAEERALDRRESPRYWVGYHPAVNDTLIGLFLFVSDGMFVDYNPDYLRRITTTMTILTETLGYNVAFEEERSASASRKFQFFLRSIEWETYMLNDVDSDYLISVDDSRLVVTGQPDYHYGSVSGSMFQEAAQARDFFVDNRSDLEALNPIVYAVVYDFARMVAFFNYVEQQDPSGFDRFIERLSGIDVMFPPFDTPAAWTPQ